MTNPREQFTKETGKRWVSNRTAYMEWLESKVQQMDLGEVVTHGQNCLRLATACKKCQLKFGNWLDTVNEHIMAGSL